MTQRKQTTVRFGRKFVRAGGEAGASAGEDAIAIPSARVKLIGTVSGIAPTIYICTPSLHPFTQRTL